MLLNLMFDDGVESNHWELVPAAKSYNVRTRPIHFLPAKEAEIHFLNI